MNKMILRLEGLVVMLVAIYLYAHFGGGWKFFAITFLLPDVFMVGYLVNAQIGSYLYNFAHTVVVSLVILVLGVFLDIEMLWQLGLVWSAHIGMDRIMGYGLKYPTNFKDTHLHHV